MNGSFPTCLVETLSSREELLWWAGSLSVVMFVGSLILLPILVARIPADYFVREPHPFEHTPAGWLVLVVKNLLGLMLFIAGVAMLVLPGQGILTMFIGISLMNFPGKRKLEFWLVQRRPVWRAISWLRERAHCPPLMIT